MVMTLEKFPRARERGISILFTPLDDKGYPTPGKIRGNISFFPHRRPTLIHNLFPHQKKEHKVPAAKVIFLGIIYERINVLRQDKAFLALYICLKSIIMSFTYYFIACENKM